MDNHRAALWCWWQHLDEAAEWQLLHVDHHYDTLRCAPGHFRRWLRNLPGPKASISEFLLRWYDAGGTECRVVRWDNYLSLFLASHRDLVIQAMFATAGVGDKPRFPKQKTRHLSPWEALEQLEHIAAGDTWPSKAPWLVNIDLDYFTTPAFEGLQRFRLFDDAYVEAMGRTVADGLRSGHIKCATLALSGRRTISWTFLTPTDTLLCHGLAQRSWW